VYRHTWGMVGSL